MLKLANFLFILANSKYSARLERNYPPMPALIKQVQSLVSSDALAPKKEVLADISVQFFQAGKKLKQSKCPSITRFSILEIAPYPHNNLQYHHLIPLTVTQSYFLSKTFTTIFIIFIATECCKYFCHWKFLRREEAV